MLDKIPYSGKFSRENIFVNYRLFSYRLVDKDRAILLIRKMLYLAHQQKFSPAKFPTIRYIFIYHSTLIVIKINSLYPQTVENYYVHYDKSHFYIQHDH